MITRDTKSLIQLHKDDFIKYIMQLFNLIQRDTKITSLTPLPVPFTTTKQDNGTQKRVFLDVQ